MRTANWYITSHGTMAHTDNDKPNGQINAKQSNSRTGGHKISLVMYFFSADMGSFLSCYRWWCVCFITLWRHNMCITDTMPLEFEEGGIFSFAMQLVLRVLWYTLQNNQMSISDRMPQSFIDHVFLFCRRGTFSFALAMVQRVLWSSGTDSRLALVSP